MPAQSCMTLRGALSCKMDARRQEARKTRPTAMTHGGAGVDSTSGVLALLRPHYARTCMPGDRAVSGGGGVLEDRGVWPRPERVCAAGRLARDAVSDSGGLRTVEADWE